MLNELYQRMDPIAFSVGPLTVHWYALAYLAGFALAAFIIWKTARHWRLRFTADDLLILMCGVMIGMIVGARLGYVLLYGNGYYFTHPLEIFAMSQGGMSFHGGLIGLLVAGFIASRILHIPFLTLADLSAIAAPVGLFLGRCANFVNGELWGAETDLPWGVVFGGAAGMISRHPSQLYEAALEGVMIFVVLILLSRKLPPRPRGSFLGVFLALYGLARFTIEFVRQPDVQLGYLWGGWLTMGQLLSVPLIIAGIVLVIWSLRTKLPQEPMLEQTASSRSRPSRSDLPPKEDAS